MTPAELQQLLITRAPDVPGMTAAARRDDENPYGPTVTLGGGTRVWWTITGASPAGPVPAPDLTSRPVPVAQVEQALIATTVARVATRSAMPTATAGCQAARVAVALQQRSRSCFPSRQLPGNHPTSDIADYERLLADEFIQCGFAQII